uniref:Protein kinase domain-containing protein n=1 Tax=Salix viminalis TaxID=40686 RepID=A0A6N2MII7_SALVM
MQHLSGHPGVVTLKAAYEDLESLYLVMELCPEGRLLDEMAIIVMTWEFFLYPYKGFPAPSAFFTSSIPVSFPLSGHPWIVFYTEPTQKELTPKPKFQAHVTLTSQQLTLSTGLESDGSKITASGFLIDDCSPVLSSDGSRSRVEQHDCGLIDALTV